MNENLKKEFIEYQLMVEEVLGGMDVMLSTLERRILHLEQKLAEVGANSSSEKLDDLQCQLEQLDEKLTCGLNLAFSKIDYK